MKIIFLDIDGVLNSIQWFEKKYDAFKNHCGELYHHSVDDVPLNMLLDILEKNGNVKIVLSSSWRRSTLTKTIQEFQSYNTNISKLTKYMIGVTKRLHEAKDKNGRWISRGNEIKDFIERCEVPITEYCIVDDDSDMLDEQMEHFVHTKTKIGLTPDDSEKIKKILKL